MVTQDSTVKLGVVDPYQCTISKHQRRYDTGFWRQHTESIQHLRGYTDHLYMWRYAIRLSHTAPCTTNNIVQINVWHVELFKGAFRRINILPRFETVNDTKASSSLWLCSAISQEPVSLSDEPLQSGSSCCLRLKPDVNGSRWRDRWNDQHINRSWRLRKVFNNTFIWTLKRTLRTVWVLRRRTEQADYEEWSEAHEYTPNT